MGCRTGSSGTERARGDREDRSRSVQRHDADADPDLIEAALRSGAGDDVPHQRARPSRADRRDPGDDRPRPASGDTNTRDLGSHHLAQVRPEDLRSGSRAPRCGRRPPNRPLLRRALDLRRLPVRHLEGSEQAVEALKRWLRRPGSQPSQLLALAVKMGPKAAQPIRAALQILL
jgi:hypothetical protein